MARLWRAYLGSDARSAFCRNCGSDEVRRSQCKNVVERTLLRLLSLYPYRCKNCWHRYFTIGPIQQKIAPSQTTSDSAHAH